MSLLMPIGFSFNTVTDARRRVGEGQPPSPRPAPPPKSNVFSRFNSSTSCQTPIALSPHHSSIIPTFSFSKFSHRISRTSPPPILLQAHDTNPTASHVTDPLDLIHRDSSVAASSPLSLLHSLPPSHARFNSSFTSPSTSNSPPAHPTPSARSALAVEPSPFRPPVIAAHRLAAWSSPFAKRHRQLLKSSLPPTFVDSAYRVVHDALADSTRTTYAAGLLRFQQFCDAWKISEEDRMPASPALLTSFVAHCSGLYAGNTIHSWISGIRSWHVLNQAEWHGDCEWVNLARVAANKSGVNHKRAPRAPVSLEHLRVLRQQLDISLPFHAAVWATALTTFFGCRRLGETTIKSHSTFNTAYHATRSSPIRFTTQSDGSSSATIRIPWTKTTREEGASIIITARGDELCPVDALRNHLMVNKNAPTSSSLFAYQQADGGWTHMLRDTFLKMVNGIWLSTSLDHVSGHSFRIGGTVALLLAGVSPEVVAATGGWKSLAFLLYWRRLEDIIPMSTTKAYNKSDISSLNRIFEAFRVRNNISKSALSSS